MLFVAKHRNARQQGEAAQLPGVGALHKLHYHYLLSPARGAERQAQGRGGFSLAVAGVDVDHAPSSRIR